MTLFLLLAGDQDVVARTVMPAATYFWILER